MGAAIDYAYKYLGGSAFETANGKPQLRLATFGGVEDNPYFFQGKLLQPRRSTDMMLAVARLARTRFFLNTAGIDFDPVVTCAEDRIRFESFSSCCGVYCRADLTEQAFEGDLLGRGTTNVDFNPPMRAALSKIRSGEEVGLSVGLDEVRVDTATESATERKVALPVRWLKGFVEVQAHQSRLVPRFAIKGPEVRRFLRSLPRTQMKRPSFIVSAGKGLRLSQVRTKDSVFVAGVERLRVLEDVMAGATELRIFGQPEEGSAGFELVFDEARFHLVLSPSIWRGFSGEGQVLGQLAEARSEENIQRAMAALNWNPRIDTSSLMQATGLDAAAIEITLATLGARGLVGFDLHEEAYFHRELPFDLTMVEKLQPRLKAARKLVDEGQIEFASQTEDLTEAWVPGSGVKQRVKITPEGAKCTCTWYAKHKTERGPCKHVLAVQILSAGDGDE